MRGDPKLYRILKQLQIPFDYYEHPPVPTIEEAKPYWKEIEATHCKNLFFRNHKGDQHYLVILDHVRQLSIHDLEKKLNQGKISFASEQRLNKYLGLNPGSVSPFGLINDSTHHVSVFFDLSLQNSSKISFHPNINTADLVISLRNLIKFMDWTKNQYSFLQLYDL